MPDRVLYNPPLFTKERHGDRTYSLPTSPIHWACLSIPHGDGRVRLWVTIPWIQQRLHVPVVTLMWQRPCELASVHDVASVVADALHHQRRKRTSRPAVDCYPIKVLEWRGEVFAWRADREVLARLPKADVLLNVSGALEFASRILTTHRWARVKWADRLYVAHRHTAMLVANEIAHLYCDDRTKLVDSAPVERAEPIFVQRIQDAYGPGEKLTPRRLALALIAAKFDGVPPLKFRILESERQTGISEANLWSRLLPSDHAARLREQLWPTDRVRDLLDWPRDRWEQDYRADWLVSWWSLLAKDPLGSLVLRKPPARSVNFLDVTPGAKDWAFRVWEALYR